MLKIDVLMRRFEIDELEELLRQKKDQYLMYPSERVWKNIEKNIQPSQTLTIVSAVLLFLLSAGISVLFNEQKLSTFTPPSGQLAFQLSENKWESTLPLISIHGGAPSNKSESFFERHRFENAVTLVPSSDPETLEHPLQAPLFAPIVMERNWINPITALPKNKRPGILQSISNVFDKAKQIGKEAKWQIYFSPTMGYRSLRGSSSSSNYLYNSYSFSTTSLFANTVKDAVIHKPGMGFEAGAALYYPITKNLSVKAGLQANYQQYEILASRGYPEIATYGMNNVGFTTQPINAVSNYINANNYTSSVTLRNERFMISMPLGIDYKVIGNKMLYFSVASTIQPTYVLNSSAYLISTNLRNYAKAPNLNRRWNINTGIEANVHFQKGSYKWSVGPQFRYQLLHSFTDKYPIKENLYDIGLRVGIMKTF